MSEAAAAPSEKKGLNTKLIMQILFAVVNLTITGGGAFLVYSATLAHEAPKITEEGLRRELASVNKEKDEFAETPYIYTMDKFVVNLGGGEPRRTIRLEVNLEMLNQEGFEEIMSVESRAHARDSIMKLLGDKDFSELEPLQGKLFLKNQISGEINKIIKKGIVKDVFFSDFVVQ